MAQPFVERRAHPRRKIRVKMELELSGVPDADPKLLHEYSVQQSAFSRNISEGGILMLTSDAITLGTRIRVTVPVHEFNTSISLVGEVVRCEPGDMGYKTALKFIDPDSEDSAVISRYVAAG